ncbi:acetyltransferase [Parapedobacter defluvii]|uniref:acetyltransferase n=1 Tax=Parapedobacter defluvii TaxID=2045106 RepID=UPI00333F5A0E
MSERKLYLYGASGHGKVVTEIAESLGLSIGGFVDANPVIRELLEYPVSTDLPLGEQVLFISIGNNRIRKKLVSELVNEQFATLIHPDAIVSRRSIIGNGTVIMGGAALNADVKIGTHCIINTNASVDHDCQLDDFVHISPNVALAGDVSVGEGTHIGIGACVIQGVRIGKWCTVGAGAVIIGDVPDGATVVGNPGRIIKTNE